MTDLIELTDLTSININHIFDIADMIQNGEYRDILSGRTVVMFLPDSSIRTRVSFEKGIHMLGGLPILFPTSALDKKEDIRDVCGYLNNWADIVIVRHKSIEVLNKMAQYLNVPVINAMTDINHPCEILSDMYALSKIRDNFLHDKYLFCGTRGNIGMTWKEASDVMGFELEQCCAPGYEIGGLRAYYNIEEAIAGKDIVCTDSLSERVLPEFTNYQITSSVMKMANKNAVLNPCPPFYRGEEVSEEVIDSEYYVGYEFKKYLLVVQQAIMIYCIEN